MDNNNDDNDNSSNIYNAILLPVLLLLQSLLLIAIIIIIIRIRIRIIKNNTKNNKNDNGNTFRCSHLSCFSDMRGLLSPPPFGLSVCAGLMVHADPTCYYQCFLLPIYVVALWGVDLLFVYITNILQWSYIIFIILGNSNITDIDILISTIEIVTCPMYYD